MESTNRNANLQNIPGGSFTFRWATFPKNQEGFHSLQDKELQSCNQDFIEACFQNQFQKQLYKSQLIA